MPFPDRRWMLVPLLALVGLPLLMLAASWIDPQPDTWQHLRQYLLPLLIRHTGLLLLVVGLGVILLGVSLAWLSACCEFPGRRWLDPLLVIPLAFPTYVLAFIYLGLLDFGGPVQTGLREFAGGVPAWIDALRSPAGVLFVLILAFYPYVYLLARVSFISGGLSAFEAGRSLGASPLRVFLRVSLPAARPAIVAGLALAMMETLADFGAVAIYGFETFTTAVYRTWFGLFNLTAAVQLASLLMLFMLVLLIAERFVRRSNGRHAERRHVPYRIRLTGWRRWAASGFQSGVVLLAVFIPLIQLLIWSWPGLGDLASRDYLGLVGNTMILGTAGAIAALACGLALLAATHRRGARMAMLAEVAALGYAIPGAVLAVAIMLAFIGFDRVAGTALAGGLIALVLAYVIRFLRVAWGPLDGVAGRLRPEYSEVARSLGVTRWQRWRRVTVPLMWPGLVAAFLLALVEIAKEMPATLMLRPFGWDTLAVRIFELTSEGQWESAAVPALVLVALGAIPVILLLRRAGGVPGRVI